MKEAKRDLFISLAIFAVAFLTAAIIIGANASGTVQTLSKTINQTEKPVIEPVQEQSNNPEIPESSNNTPQQAQTTHVAPEAVETYIEPSQPQNTTQSVSEPQMERIPFTNKPVEAGNPESYIDTYGQCPFYENAGPKGCVPPPDIECNADWSVCTYKGE